MSQIFEFLKKHPKTVATLLGLITFGLLGTAYVAMQTPSGVPLPNRSNPPFTQKQPTQKLPQATVQHIKSPKNMKAIYITSWVGSQKKWREELIKFVENTEINAVIIDVKDYSGYISFDTKDPYIKQYRSEEIRIPDLREWIKDLHQRGIYTIARITVFQDPVYAERNPTHAVQTTSGKIWKDRHNLAYIDVKSKPFWTYIIHIAKAAEQAGFDEVNFDYIRYPTDGNMKDIRFPLSGQSVTQKNKLTTGNVYATSQREINLKEFFSHLRTELKDIGIPMSADIFGMTMTNKDDVGIGQVLESVEPYFDYICPMVYPSHYPKGFNKLQNPADHPYEIIHFAMTSGVERLKKRNISPQKLRPWLQDFHLGAHYDASKIRAQIKATYDSGLTSFLIWDPRNKYTRDAYLPSKNEAISPQTHP